MPDQNPPDDEIGYAQALSELDTILDEIDDDAIDIDVLSERVERAAHLIAVCRGRIASAENRVAAVVEGLTTTGSTTPD